jgi:hypothetical protein
MHKAQCTRLNAQLRDSEDQPAMSNALGVEHFAFEHSALSILHWALFR